jgi:hypothetical protein
VVWWLEHDLPCTPVELAEISYRFSAAELNTLFEQTIPSGKKQPGKDA